MARMTRYALYYRLIDISFVTGIAMIALEIADSAYNLVLPEPINTWLTLPVFVLSFFLPSFLVFARFMRDDFAQQLWQQAAGTVLKALIILPLPIAFILGAMVAFGQIDFPEASFSGREVSTSDGGAALGIIYSFVYLWIFAPLVFTFSFQWHRWRASR